MMKTITYYYGPLMSSDCYFYSFGTSQELHHKDKENRPAAGAE